MSDKSGVEVAIGCIWIFGFMLFFSAASFALGFFVRPFFVWGQ